MLLEKYAVWPEFLWKKDKTDGIMKGGRMEKCWKQREISRRAVRGAVKHMRNIQEIDRELERARQKMERSRKLDVILQDLKEQSGRRRRAEEEARAVLEKEQGDVEELERMSLVSFLARIQGDLESRKAEERREAAMAKARYDAAKWDLEDLDRRLRDFAQEKESLKGLEKQYQALLDEKEAVLRSQGGAQSQRLGQLAQEQERTAGELREIQEAIQAGLAAQRALEEMSGDLSGAENWGVWDMVGGGIMATFAKHGCLDDAQDAAYEARRALSRFRTELADVSSEQVPDVELGDFAVFADYFFDGLFADLFVQSRIREAQEQVEAVTQRVERLIVRLRDERENLEEKQGQLDWERERLLTAQNRAQLQSGAETGEAVPV